MMDRFNRLWIALSTRVQMPARGASTTEYTLVILVAASIALLLLNWAQGGRIVAFFDTIFDKVVAMFDGSSSTP